MNELISNKKKWEVFCEYAAGRDYGEIIPHKAIAEMIGESYGTGKYRSAITMARTALLKQGKYIESIVGKGYRVAFPDDYSQLAISKFTQGARSIQKGCEVMEYAPMDSMSEGGRTVHRALTDRVKLISASVISSCVELNLLSKKPHPLLPENAAQKMAQ
ncbi:MAG: hypothetical protein FWH48_11935 [Oscillospiraceae bacterium]|nr:hypothetical protein [Oscillospiraceae bacterium]